MRRCLLIAFELCCGVGVTGCGAFLLPHGRVLAPETGFRQKEKGRRHQIVSLPLPSSTSRSSPPFASSLLLGADDESSSESGKTDEEVWAENAEKNTPEILKRLAAQRDLLAAGGQGGRREGGSKQLPPGSPYRQLLDLLSVERSPFAADRTRQILAMMEEEGVIPDLQMVNSAISCLGVSGAPGAWRESLEFFQKHDGRLFPTMATYEALLNAMRASPDGSPLKEACGVMHRIRKHCANPPMGVHVDAFLSILSRCADEDIALRIDPSLALVKEMLSAGRQLSAFSVGLLVGMMERVTKDAESAKIRVAQVEEILEKHKKTTDKTAVHALLALSALQKRAEGEGEESSSVSVSPDEAIQNSYSSSPCVEAAGEVGEKEKEEGVSDSKARNTFDYLVKRIGAVERSPEELKKFHAEIERIKQAIDDEGTENISLDRLAEIWGTDFKPPAAGSAEEDAMLEQATQMVLESNPDLRDSFATVRSLFGSSPFGGSRGDPATQPFGSLGGGLGGLEGWRGRTNEAAEESMGGGNEGQDRREDLHKYLSAAREKAFGSLEEKKKRRQRMGVEEEESQAVGSDSDSSFSLRDEIERVGEGKGETGKGRASVGVDEAEALEGLESFSASSASFPSPPSPVEGEEAEGEGVSLAEKKGEGGKTRMPRFRFPKAFSASWKEQISKVPGVASDPAEEGGEETGSERKGEGDKIPPAGLLDDEGDTDFETWMKEDEDEGDFDLDPDKWDEQFEKDLDIDWGSPDDETSSDSFDEDEEEEGDEEGEFEEFDLAGFEAKVRSAWMESGKLEMDCGVTGQDGVGASGELSDEEKEKRAAIVKLLEGFDEVKRMEGL
uniref:Pentacotripeptide-repeat region of PRORP domain-containing protein n=1 Tax=Chromera velia CCMP2878 TaxID=1169474 RepID=A0A0G4F2T5_9ALVE|eukprot:Cvel_14890.t1-p1 / transcript=Cvel_14890.t1 / gene=Cvel_14890 / organism=Chromera_velia_CCMP2878 / gene_product=hypothetical protein / transcript_product=hypothetical protein / location=Cvel_scaffold1077:47557-50079(-) / protein_length=841 / sequence_SO=supercontig / SO=protein_coding / is_pseudo=false